MMKKSPESGQVSTAAARTLAGADKAQSRFTVERTKRAYDQAKKTLLSQRRARDRK
jgi:hypothetical protein